MRTCHLALLAVALFAANPLAASGQGRPFRTRAADERSWHLVTTALSASPTVARQVAALEETDVIVVVQLCMVLPPAQGDIRILSAAGGVRHLRVRVTTAVATWEQVAVLGHELQHALEIAADAEVRDVETLERLFKRIGFRHWGRALGGGWETLAAIEAGDTVATEVRAAKVR